MTSWTKHPDLITVISSICYSSVICRMGLLSKFNRAHALSVRELVIQAESDDWCLIRHLGYFHHGWCLYVWKSDPYVIYRLKADGKTLRLLYFRIDGKSLYSDWERYGCVFNPSTPGQFRARPTMTAMYIAITFKDGAPYCRYDMDAKGNVVGFASVTSESLLQ